MPLAPIFYYNLQFFSPFDNLSMIYIFWHDLIIYIAFCVRCNTLQIVSLRKLLLSLYLPFLKTYNKKLTIKF